MVLMSIFWPLAHRAPAGLAGRWPLWLVRLAHWLRFRAQPEADGHAARWRRSWKALVLAQGAMWGVAVWLFWGLGTPYHLRADPDRLSYCLGSVQLLATQPRVFLAFLCLVLVPTIVRIATDTSQPWHRQLAFILTLLFCITLADGPHLRQRARPGDPLKARTDQLAAQLRDEMAVAERGAPRRRGRQPRQDAVLRRRQPRPAPAAARDGPVCRGAAPAQRTTPRWPRW